MPRYDYILVDVFTDRKFGGNQLAVFPDARGLSAQQMQCIGNELNLAETTFVLPPEDSSNDFRVRIFTASREMPMAGHPTIGTAFVLASQGLIDANGGEATVRFEEMVGVIPVKIRWEGGKVSMCQMQQPLPEFGPVFEDRDQVARVLGVAPDTLDPNLPLEVVSCGVPYLIVPLKDLKAVEKIQVRPELFLQLKPAINEANIYAFTRHAVTDLAHLHSRMFWLEHGILAEDAATGSASGPLGSYLARHKVFGDLPRLDVVNEQGFEMNRPSFIQVQVDQSGGQISAVRVGGQAIPMGGGYFDLD